MISRFSASCVATLAISGPAFAQPAPPDESNVRLGPGVARPAMRWVLRVSGGGLPRPQAATIAEYQEGDVPMPQATPWQCKWLGVSAYRDRDMLAAVDGTGQPTGAYERHETVVVSRTLRCSSDGFKTSMSHAGSYVVYDGRIAADRSQAQAHLSWTKANGGEDDISIELRPCPLAASPQVSGCTMNFPPLAGRPTT